jgi:hypothetical protein
MTQIMQTHHSETQRMRGSCQESGGVAASKARRARASRLNNRSIKATQEGFFIFGH